MQLFHSAFKRQSELAFWYEFLAFWGGGVSMKKMAKIFAVTERCVKGGLASKQEHPLIKRRNGDRLSRFKGSHDQLTTHKLTFDEIIDIVLSEQILQREIGYECKFACAVEDLRWTVTRREDLYIFAKLFGILNRKHCAADISYIAKTGPLEARFSPHALIRTSRRTHLRGYLQKGTEPGRYVDLVLNRFISAEESKADYVNDERDILWHEKLISRFKIADDFPKNMLPAIENEYHLQDGILEVETTQALLKYTINEIKNYRIFGVNEPIFSLVN